MAYDMAYFKRCIREDPTYEVKHAIVDYLSGDFDEAIEVANQICELDNCYDDKLLSYDEVYDFIELMSPVDAFDMGRYSDDITGDGYYRIDGYGHFSRVLKPWDCAKNILYDGFEHIVNGEVEISDELQAVIDLFDEDSRSNNRKSAPRKKPASKAGAKRPAKSQCVKRSGNAGKAPAKKTAQSNNRKPRTTSGKKPANRGC